MDTQTKRRTLQPYEMGNHPEFGALAQSVNSVQVWFGMAQNPETRDMALRALARDAEKVAEVARAMLAGAANEVTS